MMASVVFKSVILGAPASGKGTISSRILKNFNLEHISSGDRLRQHIQKKDSITTIQIHPLERNVARDYLATIGLEAQKYIQAGQLVPDEVIIKFVSSEIKNSSNESWLLDGFPRTISQAEALWKVQKLDLVINLVVPFQVIVDRVKGRWVHLPSGRVYNDTFNAPKIPGTDDVTGEKLVQREDDKPDVVLKRLEQYEKLTLPVVDFYRDKNILREFKGNTSDEIWPKVLECLSCYMPLNIRTQTAQS